MCPPLCKPRDCSTLGSVTQWLTQVLEMCQCGTLRSAPLQLTGAGRLSHVCADAHSQPEAQHPAANGAQGPEESDRKAGSLG